MPKNMLLREYQGSAIDKEEAEGLTIGKQHSKNVVIKANDGGAEAVSNDSDSEDDEIIIKKNTVEEKEEAVEAKADKLKGLSVVGKIDLDSNKAKKPAEEKKEEPKPKEEPKKEEPKAKEEPKKEEPKAKEEPKKEEPKAKEEPKKEEPKPKEEPKEETVKQEENSIIEAKADKLKGLSVLGKIELPKKPEKKESPVASSDVGNDGKRKRKRIRTNNRVDVQKQGKFIHKKKKGDNKNTPQDKEISQKDIQEKIKATMARMGGGNQKAGGDRSKYRKEKRDAYAEQREEELLKQQEDAKTLKVTEFISANDLATMIGISVNEIISMCMSLGMFVSINQRLDAEAITIIAEEYGYKVNFTTVEEETEIIEEEEAEEDESSLEERAPIVTIMGHVDHGKTSLLDYIRDAKVAAGEAGGITQHIGAYRVKTNSGKPVTFLDTPGHEAFTAMRARGAKVTDIVILVVAADDRVMPQTKEAINHALVAEVPIIVAINKVDKPTANADKIREELSAENILVEDWGGKYQCQEISAKTGAGIDDLLEKILLESEVMELKANPNKKAVGTVVEASLDKGRGYVTTVLVQAGTMKIGDIMIAGPTFGRVKAMTDHRGRNIKEAGPSTPVQILGLDGAPQAGDKFNIMDTDREAREIATKRAQLLREQTVRTQKHLTLDEIGRRLAIGTFKELNLIVKGDVDGSVEALTDSLLKLSTEEVQVNIIHKGVGAITESDVLLATASDAIIIGFQVRPSGGAKKLAETEEIQIKLYSVIYKAIDEVKDALEGLLEPTVEEVVTGNIEVRETFKISKVGTVAGCYVLDGIVKRKNPIRLIRDGIVVYSGEMGALKRFKDDVQEVKFGYECGLSIKNFNDIKVGDVIESYEEREVKRTL